ncbi:hypothetical protein HA466_0018280 [Hirschfeldia incana]|nr:hypothetical protein HA466_0018280 [Hirschfeldia incana]
MSNSLHEERVSSTLDLWPSNVLETVRTEAAPETSREKYSTSISDLNCLVVPPFFVAVSLKTSSSSIR